MKPQFSLAAAFLVITFGAITLAAITLVSRCIGVQAWFLIVALSPIGIPVGFAGFFLGRRQANLTFLILFAATEAIASALFYFFVGMFYS